eukprot:gene7105-11268_t
MSYLAKARIHVVEADDVPKMDAFGGKSDPFVEIELGGKFKKTSTKNNSDQPIWNEKFELPFEKMSDEINFALYDSDGISSNDLIAKVSVPVSDLKPGPNDMWLTLPEVKGACAKLHVVLQLDPTIHVNVVNANDLKASDLNGKSDPYCVLYCGKEKERTKTINNSCNPNWNEYFIMEVHDLEDPVLFKVYDDDFGKDDCLGEAILTLSSLEEEENKVTLELNKGGTLSLNVKKIGF